MRRILALLPVLAAAAAFAPGALAGGYTDESYLTPIGKVGVPYSHTIAWKPGTGCPPYGYHLDPGNHLPPGLSLNVSSGAITGVPTAAGTYTFYVSQIDQCGVEGQGNAPFKITIQGGVPPVPILTITTATPPNGEVSLPYSTSLTASGGSGTKAWSLAGGQLPPGLTLSAGGQIAGTPSGPGTFGFTVAVRDGSGSASKSLSLTVIPGIVVAQSPVAPTAEVRTPFTASVATILGTSGGAPPYRYAPVSGFPYGIGFDASAGTIFGSPRQPGTLSLVVSVTDANRATRQVTISLTVVPRLHIVPIDLHRGKVGSRYRATIAVTGGKEPSWTVTAGRLPAGLRLDASTGVVSGRPRRAGSSAFTVTVTDSLGAKVAIRYVLRVGR